MPNAAQRAARNNIAAANTAKAIKASATSKPPTKTAIQSHMVDDLRTVFLIAVENGNLHPSDVVIFTDEKINLRYSRELVGVLTKEGLLTLSEEDGEEYYSSTTPLDTEEEATTHFNAWAEKRSLAKPAEAKPTATHPRTKKVVNETGKCYCGCGANSTSYYRPGHDARHAGQVARDMAQMTRKADREKAVKVLPSEALQKKASDMADRLMAKASAKKATDSAKA